MKISRVSFFLALFTIAVLSSCAQIDVCKEVISTKNAPAAIGPYSQAVRAGNILFLSGQIPIDPKTNQLMATETIEEQTKLVIENLRNEFPRMNAVYGTYFKEAPPARSTIEVSRLPQDVKIEITAIAVKQRCSD